MTNPVREVTVKIRGSAIQLRTDMEEAEVARIAELVDKTMRSIDPRGVLSPAKASMLTSLTLAGELMEAREQTSRSHKALTQRLKIMHDVVDDALQDR